MKKIIVFLLLSLPFLAGAQERLSPKHYRAYSVKLEKEVPLQAIIDEMATYDVLFFGEEHSDSVGHYLEDTIFRMMHTAYLGKTVLSLEMFDRDVQFIMNEYLGGFTREKTFKKDARAWKNYSNYRPMVEFAKTNKLPVICANAPGRYSNLAGRKGQKALMDLPKAARPWMAPLPYDTASGDYYKKLMGESGHTTDTAKPDTAKPKAPIFMGEFNLVMAQSLWDATMAYSIASFCKKHKGVKVFQVNGNFHSDEGFAVVTQLKKYGSRLKPLIISCVDNECFYDLNWKDIPKTGDYLIMTDPNIKKTYEE
jgi:uncharacterized iron-regulated protein